MDNKKLVKVLMVSGVSLLIVFIIARVALKTSGDRVTEMPTIGELKYEPAKVKEESKVEQFEEQKKEIDRKAMGYDNSQYVIPNFNNLLDKKDNSVIQQSSANNSPATFTSAGKNLSAGRHDVSYGKPASSQSLAGPASSQYKTSSSVPTTPIPPKAGIPGKAGTKKESTPNSKLNYHSDYFNNNNETTPLVQEVPKADNSASSRNPFGTIISDNNQGQKQTTNLVNFYSAEIYGDQSIQDGGVVLIRNTAPMQYLNISIPRNSILYGQASFRGNRVFVSINRVKTSSGEFSVSFAVKDNDKIDGLYYKAPIDETVDKTKEGVNAPSIPIPGVYGAVINSVTQSALSGGKDLMKRTSSLNLEEGYKVYINPK